MVEGKRAGRDSSDVPTFGELLTQYRDRTGASYEDMSRAVGGAITTAWFEKLHKNQIKSFPRNPATVEHLADLLGMRVSTIVLVYAATIGLEVSESGTPLINTMPAGTDSLEPGDVEAIRAVVRQLVDARQEIAAGSERTEAESAGQVVDLARPPLPDWSQLAARHGESEGRRRVEQQDNDANNP